MDGLTLLRRAYDAGLRVEAAGDKLLIRGPKRAESVVQLLAEHKAEVLEALAAKAMPADQSHAGPPSPSGSNARSRRLTASPVWSSPASPGVAGCKSWIAHSCISASSAVPMVPSDLASIYARAGSAAGSVPHIVRSNRRSLGDWREGKARRPRA
jgi:hypothetical protein